MKNQPTEFWVNVFGMDQNKAYGMCHTNLKDAEYSLKSDMLAYRIHVKMKSVKPMPYKPFKPLMKVFGVEVPGVHWGDGRLGVHYSINKSDKNDLWY